MQRAVRLLFLAFAVGMFGAIFLSAASARAASPTVQVAIDVDTSDNGDNALGPTDTCNSTPLAVGDTIDIDVVVRGVPPAVPETTTTPRRDGIGASSFNLLFDPSILQVNNIQAFDGPTILKAAKNPIPFAILDYDGHGSADREPPPGRSGNVRVDMANLGSNSQTVMES